MRLRDQESDQERTNVFNVYKRLEDQHVAVPKRQKQGVIAYSSCSSFETISSVDFCTWIPSIRHG